MTTPGEGRPIHPTPSSLKQLDDWLENNVLANLKKRLAGAQKAADTGLINSLTDSIAFLENLQQTARNRYTDWWHEVVAESKARQWAELTERYESNEAHRIFRAWYDEEPPS